MKSLHEEYGEIVKGVRHLLEKELPKKQAKKAPLPLPQKKVSPPPKVEGKKEEVIEKATPKPKVVTPALRYGPFVIEKSPPPPFIDLAPIKECVQKLRPPQVLLLCFSKESLPFLTKVASALSEKGLAATARVEAELQPNYPHPFLLTEYHEAFAKRHSLPKEFHKLFSFSQKKRILFLHPISEYLSAIERKRDLWKILKTLLPQ